MKISHELPLSLFQYSAEFNDYEYCLPHLLDKFPDYRQFFLDSSERGRFIIMDNGLFEGVKHTTQDLLEKIDLIEPNIFIVPDEWNDRDITAKNAKHWTQYKLPFKTKLMVVLQGKNVNEIHTLYQQCVDLGYTHFAINHSSIVYQSLCESDIEIANQSVGRVMLIEYLRSQNIIKDHHYIHLLGASTPQEFTYYRDNLPTLINSVDTSNPIICGALGQRYEEVGMLTKPKNKIEEFMEVDLEDRIEDIKYNVQRFKDFCNK
jgi:hypothetical protein